MSKVQEDAEEIGEQMEESDENDDMINLKVIIDLISAAKSKSDQDMKQSTEEESQNGHWDEETISRRPMDVVKAEAAGDIMFLLNRWCGTNSNTGETASIPDFEQVDAIIEAFWDHLPEIKVLPY